MENAAIRDGFEHLRPGSNYDKLYDAAVCRAGAEKIRMESDGQAALVLSVERQVKTVQLPRLYDLTTLQRECNRIYGYTAQQTLDYV